MSSSLVKEHLEGQCEDRFVPVVQNILSDKNSVMPIS